MKVYQRGLGEIDWGAIFGKVADAVPGVVKSVYDYKTAKATGGMIPFGTTGINPNDPYIYNPNYSGTYSGFPNMPGQSSDFTPYILGGIVLVGAFLLLRKN